MSGWGQTLEDESDKKFTFFGKIYFLLLFIFKKILKTSKCLEQKNGYTMAETLITLLIVALITVIAISVINNNAIKRKVILTQYDSIYSQLSDLVSLTAQNSEKNYDIYSTEPLTMKNLKCTNEDDLSKCLKIALLKNSPTSQTTSNSNETFKNYVETNTALQAIFQEIIETASLPVFTLPSSAQVAVAYFDKSCNTEIPVYKKGNTVETIRACGFLLADVNNIKKPNNYAQANKFKDTFLMPITKNGLERSQYVLNETAGCSNSETYNPDMHSCSNNRNICPNDYFYNQITYNSEKMIRQNVRYEGVDCWEYKCKDGTPLTIREQCLGHELCRFGNEWDESAKACVCKAPNNADLTIINEEEVSFCHSPCQNGQDWDKNSIQCTCQKGAEDEGYCHLPCIGGQSWNYSSKACQCPSGQNWSGSQCVTCGSNQYWNGTSCQCNAGYTWSGAQCKIAKECRYDESSYVEGLNLATNLGGGCGTITIQTRFVWAGAEYYRANFDYCRSCGFGNWCMPNSLLDPNVSNNILQEKFPGGIYSGSYKYSFGAQRFSHNGTGQSATVGALSKKEICREPI